MRYAVFTLTLRGYGIARLLEGNLAVAVDVFVPAKDDIATDNACIKPYESLRDVVKQAFRGYDALIFIMAAGIAVRMVAPLLQSKLTDPAVIALDERAGHVISLLSGHVGGANALTRRIADILGAEPVITTATDVNAKLAPDALAAELKLRPYPREHIKNINKGLLENQKISYFIDADLRRASFYHDELKKRGIVSEIKMPGEALPENILCVWITDREIPIHGNILVLQPRKLVAGIGCRRGTSEKELYEALAAACRQIRCEPVEVNLLASTIVKEHEAGLLSLANQLGTGIRFFSQAELQLKIAEYSLEESDFVKQQIGAGNVCEAAALCCVRAGQIALQKTKFMKVTVALIWEK